MLQSADLSSNLFLAKDRLGVRMLRKAWVNVDLVWVATLIATGLITILL